MTLRAGRQSAARIQTSKKVFISLGPTGRNISQCLSYESPDRWPIRASPFFSLTYNEAHNLHTGCRVVTYQPAVVYECVKGAIGQSR